MRAIAIVIVKDIPKQGPTQGKAHLDAKDFSDPGGYICSTPSGRKINEGWTHMGTVTPKIGVAASFWRI